MSFFYIAIPNNYLLNVLNININELNYSILYIYNNKNFISLNVCDNSKIYYLFFNKNTNVIVLKNYSNKKIFKAINNELFNYLFSLDNLYYKKLKFSGKGFKIKKKKFNIILYFNTAHTTMLICRNNINIRLLKNKYIFLKSNKYDNFLDGFFFKCIKQNNIFTKRGLRFCRQIIYKKKGKN